MKSILSLSGNDWRKMRRKTIEEMIEENNIERYYFLLPFGTCGYAFPREEALKIIEALKENFYNILGGDVYTLDGDEISLTYENWFCSPKKNEPPQEFFLRSYEMAISFVQERLSNENYLYNFVFAEMEG